MRLYMCKHGAAAGGWRAKARKALQPGPPSALGARRSSALTVQMDPMGAQGRPQGAPHLWSTRSTSSR